MALLHAAFVGQASDLVGTKESGERAAVGLTVGRKEIAAKARVLEGFYI